MAVKKDASLCVEVLLARSGGSGNVLKLELDAKDKGGLTALHWAIIKDQPVVVRLLLGRGPISPFLLRAAGRPSISLGRARRRKGGSA